ncbi:NACHT domain-containing protein [Candidatus Pacearchaeota archaeon]|nr:NACHT domain-containing protein [Candidatus Pacearchaeota archaeon]
MSQIQEITPELIEEAVENPSVLKDDFQRFVVAKCLKDNVVNARDLAECIGIYERTFSYKHFLKKSWASEYTKRLLSELIKDEALGEKKFIRVGAEEKIEKSQPASNKQLHPPTPRDIEDFLLEAENEKKLILLGDTGSGKSTILRYYLKHCLLQLSSGKPDARVPVFVSLIAVRESKGIHSLIEESINDYLDSPISINPIDIHKDLLLLLDGLDEITNQELLADTIRSLTKIFPKLDSRILLSCRSKDYHKDFPLYSCYNSCLTPFL